MSSAFILATCLLFNILIYTLDASPSLNATQLPTPPTKEPTPDPTPKPTLSPSHEQKLTATHRILSILSYTSIPINVPITSHFVLSLESLDDSFELLPQNVIQVIQRNITLERWATNIISSGIGIDELAALSDITIIINDVFRGTSELEIDYILQSHNIGFLQLAITNINSMDIIPFGNVTYSVISNTLINTMFPTIKPSRNPTLDPTAVISQCFIGNACHVTEDCCPNNIHERLGGITCSIKHKNSAYYKTDSQNDDEKDLRCCIKRGYQCFNDNECCSKRTKCYENICMHRRDIAFKKYNAIVNVKKTHHTIFSGFNHFRKNELWILTSIQLFGVLLGFTIVSILFFMFIYLTGKIDAYHSYQTISNEPIFKLRKYENRDYDVQNYSDSYLDEMKYEYDDLKYDDF